MPWRNSHQAGACVTLSGRLGRPPMRGAVELVASNAGGGDWPSSPVLSTLDDHARLAAGANRCGSVCRDCKEGMPLRRKIVWRSLIPIWSCVPIDDPPAQEAPKKPRGNKKSYFYHTDPGLLPLATIYTKNSELLFPGYTITTNGMSQRINLFPHWSLLFTLSENYKLLGM